MTGSRDKTAQLWNVNGSRAQLLEGHLAEVTAVAFSFDGKTLATGSTDRTVRIWNANGSRAQFLEGHYSEITAVAFSPDGTKLLTGSQDQTARIWFVKSDALLAALWNATADCLPLDHRQGLLLESRAESEQGHARCQQEVVRRRQGREP